MVKEYDEYNLSFKEDKSFRILNVLLFNKDTICYVIIHAAKSSLTSDPMNQDHQASSHLTIPEFAQQL